MNTYNYQNNQIKETLGTITSLMQQLQTLAPNPETPDYKGPLLINNSPFLKIADEQDSMLGMMIMEGLVGTAFMNAFADCFGEGARELASCFDISNALDCYSEYICDIEEQKEKNAAHGQGTLARMSGASISKGFNARSQISAPMQAFYDDLPKRMTIERGLALAVNKLNQLADAQPEYAAPAPRFAA